MFHGLPRVSTVTSSGIMGIAPALHRHPASTSTTSQVVEAAPVLPQHSCTWRWLFHWGNLHTGGCGIRCKPFLPQLHPCGCNIFIQWFDCGKEAFLLLESAACWKLAVYWVSWVCNLYRSFSPAGYLSPNDSRRYSRQNVQGIDVSWHETPCDAAATFI